MIVHRIFRGHRLHMFDGRVLSVQGSYKIRKTQWYLCVNDASRDRVDIDRDSVLQFQREGKCTVTL